MDTTSEKSWQQWCSRLKQVIVFPDFSNIYSIIAENKHISLIGHSAGGWLARVYMKKFGFSDISLLLTLGSPHLYFPTSMHV
jgi:triacylglycerol esterase/lipase EstA (alpha/beta hydrolase family)